MWYTQTLNNGGARVKRLVIGVYEFNVNKELEALEALAKAGQVHASLREIESDRWAFIQLVNVCFELVGKLSPQMIRSLL